MEPEGRRNRPAVYYAQGMAQLQLRPFSVGEILDAAFTIYKSRFKQLITITAAVVVPLGIVQALFIASILSNPEEASIESLGSFGLVAIVGGVVTQVATAALTLAVAGAYLNDNSTWQSVLGSAFARTLTIVGASLLFFLAVTIGFFGLIVGAIIVGAGLGVFMPALMVERIGATASLSRSWSLTSGHRARVFGSWLVASIITAIVSGISGIVLGLGFSTDTSAVLANQLLGIVGSVLTTPFMAAVVVVIYFDLRVRKEGFDLEMLANQIDAAGSAAAAGSDHNPPPEAGGGVGSDTWPPPTDG